MFVIPLTLLNLLKFFDLNGGVILGEPDEVTHAEIVANFSKSFWPQFSGGPWYYSLPLYPWLGYLASFIFKNQFLGLRVVSYFFSLILALAIFFYLRWKVSERTGLAAALLWTLCPFAVYYSRIGVIEMTVIAFCFLFLLSFDYALVARRKRWAVLSGLFLSLAMLTKYTALIFVFISLIYFAALSLKRTLSDFRTIKLDIIPTIPLFTVAAVFLPIAFVFYRHDPYLFKVHTLVNLISWEKFTGARVWVGENRFPLLVWPLISKLGWWVSWPMVGCAMIGIITEIKNEKLKIKNRKGFGLFLLSFAVASFFILRRLPFYPRYFLPLVPFIVIFAGVGFDSLVRIASYQLPVTLAFPALCVLFTVLILPSSITAYKSTKHHLIEDTGQYIKSQSKQPNPWLFSNYWPHFFGKAAGTSKATWLAESEDEVRAFIPDEERTASEILKEEGGFVALEELYSKMLISPNKSRDQARQWLLENYQPAHIVIDPFPNFPHSKEKENKAKIFVVR